MLLFGLPYFYSHAETVTLDSLHYGVPSVILDNSDYDQVLLYLKAVSSNTEQIPSDSLIERENKLYEIALDWLKEKKRTNEYIRLSKLKLQHQTPFYFRVNTIQQYTFLKGLLTDTTLRDERLFLQLLRQAVIIFTKYDLYEEAITTSELTITLSKQQTYDEYFYEQHITTLEQIEYIKRNYNQAIRYAKRHLVYETQTKQKTNRNKVSSILNNIAVYHKANGETDSALIYYKKALNEQKKHLLQNTKEKNNNFFIEIIESNIAYLHREKKPYKALSKIEIELASAKRYQDKPTILGAYYNLAEIYYTINQNEQALLYLDSLQHYLTNTERDTYIPLMYKLRGQCLLALNQKNESTYYFEKYSAYINSSYKSKREFLRYIANLNKELEETDKRALETHYLLKQQEAKSYNQKIIILVSFLALLGFVILLIIIAKRNKHITLKNIQIDKSLKKETILLKELQHRVKNNLQTILGFIEIDTNSTHNVLKNRVLAISQANEHLIEQFDFERLSMQEYLLGLTKNIVNVSENIASTNITITVTAAPVILNLDKAYPIGLMINELLTNTVKHAFPEGHQSPRVTIDLHQTEKNKYQLSYSDNGIGITDQKNQEYPTADSQGMKIITLLVRQINGKMELTTEKGFHCLILFQDDNN